MGVPSSWSHGAGGGLSWPGGSSYPSAPPAPWQPRAESNPGTRGWDIGGRNVRLGAPDLLQEQRRPLGLCGRRAALLPTELQHRGQQRCHCPQDRSTPDAAPRCTRVRPLTAPGLLGGQPVPRRSSRPASGDVESGVRQCHHLEDEGPSAEDCGHHLYPARGTGAPVQAHGRL